MRDISIDLNSYVVKDLYEDVVIRQGENGASQFLITLNDEFTGDFSYRLNFQLKDAEPWNSLPLTPVEGSITYPISNVLTFYHGVLKVELQAYDLDTGYIQKSAVFLFKITPAIENTPIELPPEYASYLDLNTLLSTIIPSEEGRVEAEGGRVSAEEDRVEAEAARNTWYSAYDPERAYLVGEKFADSGNSYVCILPSLGNLPTNTTYFSVIAEKGERGLQGLAGGNITTAAQLPVVDADNNFPTVSPKNTETILAGVGAQLAHIGNKTFQDFIDANIAPWSVTAMASGTSLSSTGAFNNHKGVRDIKSSGSANSGYRYYIVSINSIKGGTSTEIIFSTASPISDTLMVNFGHMSYVDHNPLVHGIIINISGATLLGRRIVTSTTVDTATSYTLAANTWYRAKIVTNTANNSVEFTLYADNSETVLWTDTISGTLPGGVLYHALVAYDTGTASVDLIKLDYMDISFARVV